MRAAVRLGRVQDYTDLLEGFVRPLVSRELGARAALELQAAWAKGITALPAMGSDEERMRVAFRNWMFMWGTAYDFVRERLGEEGAEKFELEDVAALKRANSGASLTLLKAMRALAPGMAFGAFGKRMAYELQAFTPFSIAERTKRQLVAEIPRCEVLDHPGGEPSCVVGCQRVYTQFMREHFRVTMTTHRQDHSCTVTLAPM